MDVEARTRCKVKETHSKSDVISMTARRFALRGKNGGTHLIALPSGDIDEHVRFSKVRFVMSVVSLLLVMTDIPRTGTGLKHFGDLVNQVVSPDSGVYFGPYAYSIAQILKVPTGTGSIFQGSPGSNSTKVWSYKFDSVSIGPRALIQQLNLSTIPRCILYLEDCPTKYLSLETTFFMLDEYISTIRRTYFSSQVIGEISPPVVYLAKSYWIDRLHHYVLALLNWRHEETRLNSVHQYLLAPHHLIESNTTMLNVCNQQERTQFRPYFCGLDIEWNCKALSGADISTRWSSGGKMNIGVHIMFRLARLQRLHPQLHFDLTVSTSLVTNSNYIQRLQLASAFFRNDRWEILTVIRGRSCPHLLGSESDCDTVLISDYRYERATIVTDSDGWFRLARLLRLTSQGYVWIRIGALWCGIYHGRSRELKFKSASRWKKLFWTWATFFKIPSHVIVYGSWFPILGYAIAHYIDCGVVHVLTDVLWSSLDGSLNFNFFTYVRVASVQMRNIWFIALLCKCFVVIQVFSTHVHSKPMLLRQGLVVIRGMWIGWISTLTLFGSLRFLAFRDSNIIGFQKLPSEYVIQHNRVPLHCEAVSQYGFPLDTETIFEASLFTCAVVVVMKLCEMLVYNIWSQVRQTHMNSSGAHIIFGRSHYLPYSIGNLASCTAMAIYWRVELIKQNKSRATISVLNAGSCVRTQVKSSTTVIEPFSSSPVRSIFKSAESSFIRSDASYCKTCLDAKTVWGQRVQGCPTHEPIYEIDRRTKAIWSIIQLTNMALLTDPFVWAELYFIGRPLFLYRAHSLSSRQADGSDLFLLPCRILQLIQNTQLDTSKLSDENVVWYDLVDIVDSTLVPWTALLYCG